MRAPPLERSKPIIFVDPTSGAAETISRYAWLWMLLFGVFYLLHHKLWRHVGVVIALWFLIGIAPVAGWVIALVSWGTYSVNARQVLCAGYDRRGWQRLDGTGHVLTETFWQDAHNDQWV